MELKLVVIQGGQHRQEIQVREPETVIGRQKGCGLRIPSETVSRRHCRLLNHAGQVTVEDLGSTNGTLLNGASVVGVQVVRPGDRLSVGAVTFQIDYQLDSRPPPLPSSNPSAPEPLPLLEEPPPKRDDPNKETIPLDEEWRLPEGEEVRDILARIEEG